MNKSFVEIKYDQKIATIYLKRKEKLNALNSEFVEELIDTLKTLNNELEVHVIILTGTENSFIVGADVNEMKQLEPFSAVDFISQLQELIGLIRHLDKPVIAGVNGHCYGAGMELAVSCDLVIASDTATFGMQEVQLGLPSVIEAAIFPFVIGVLKTKELLLTGEVIQAKEASEIGLINHLVKKEEVLDKCKEFASKIASNSPHSVTLQKRLINRWLENAGLEQSVSAGKEFFGLSFANRQTNELLSSALKKED